MGTRSLGIVAAVVAIAAAVAFTVVLAAGGGRPTSAASGAAAPSACAQRLVRDWSDGRIDRTYPVRCYRSALKSLPPDMKVYSSAPDDITQALSERIVLGAQKISGHQGKTSARKIASARSSAP